MTVLSPMLEMSRSCSLSETILLQSVSTMASTWCSFTLLTRGPRLDRRDMLGGKDKAYTQTKSCKGAKSEVKLKTTQSSQQTLIRFVAFYVFGSLLTTVG